MLIQPIKFGQNTNNKLNNASTNVTSPSFTAKGIPCPSELKVSKKDAIQFLAQFKKDFKEAVDNRDVTPEGGIVHCTIYAGDGKSRANALFDIAQTYLKEHGWNAKLIEDKIELYDATVIQKPFHPIKVTPIKTEPAIDYMI